VSLRDDEAVVDTQHSDAPLAQVRLHESAHVGVDLLQSKTYVGGLPLASPGLVGCCTCAMSLLGAVVVSCLITARSRVTPICRLDAAALFWCGLAVKPFKPNTRIDGAQADSRFCAKVRRQRLQIVLILLDYPLRARTREAPSVVTCSSRAFDWRVIGRAPPALTLDI
jgi:hypothetical protein